MTDKDLLAAVGYSDATSSLPLRRIGDATATNGHAMVAEEVPVALVYNGRPHVVVMATPADLEDLAYGFSITEAIVADPSGVEHVDVVKASHGIELQIQIPSRAADDLDARARNLVARTGCGLCGVESIKEALRLPVQVQRSLAIRAGALWRAGEELSAGQTLNNETHTIHGAAWSTSDGATRFVREDVGRHNALDKVCGAIARDGRMANAGFLVVTSRASYEMVQKAATMGVELLAAVSRPTGLAVRFAEAAGLTLVGLLRGNTANVYTHAERILTDTSS
jgi:formate dehydrogenase accessory protein FdhD